jgi:hypothetical protein
LVLAAQAGQIESLKILLEYDGNANLKTRNRNGQLI